MEIRVLRYFLAVAKEGGFSAAAETLNITQPTLSRQIQELEIELGYPLFERANRNVFLTAEGMFLRQRAEEILEMVEKTKSEFSRARNAVEGDVHIGGGETEGMTIVARCIRDVQKKYPKIRFHLYSGNAQDVTERLEKGLLDFGVLIQPFDLSKYDKIDLPAKDVWGVILKKDHPLATHKTLNKNDLPGVPLICSRQVLQKSVKENGFLDWFGSDFSKMNIVATYNLLFNAALLVEEGVGCALALDKLANIRNNGSLCFRPLEPVLESALNLVWKRNQSFSPAQKAFLDAVQKKCALLHA